MRFLAKNALRHSRRTAISVRVATALLLLGCGWAVAEDTKVPPGLRVFYTGHRFRMYVPPRVEELVKAAGIQGHQLVGTTGLSASSASRHHHPFSTRGLGGSRVIQHWNMADDKNRAKQALLSGEVDVLTVSPGLSVPDEGIAKFAELGLKHNPNLRLLVQASWYPFDSEKQNVIPENAPRHDAKINAVQAAFDEWCKKLETQADDLNRQHGKRVIFIVPVSDAVLNLRAMIVDGKYPGVAKPTDLFFAGPYGNGGEHFRALAAYCNFAVIYRISPVGLKLQAAGVDDAQQAILQKLAWETVSKYPHAGIASLEN